MVSFALKDRGQGPGGLGKREEIEKLTSPCPLICYWPLTSDPLLVPAL
jgi:hypothetical protein